MPKQNNQRINTEGWLSQNSKHLQQLLNLCLILLIPGYYYIGNCSAF